VCNEAERSEESVIRNSSRWRVAAMRDIEEGGRWWRVGAALLEI